MIGRVALCCAVCRHGEGMCSECVAGDEMFCWCSPKGMVEPQETWGPHISFTFSQFSASFITISANSEQGGGGCNTEKIFSPGGGGMKIRPGRAGNRAKMCNFCICPNFFHRRLVACPPKSRGTLWVCAEETLWNSASVWNAFAPTARLLLSSPEILRSSQTSQGSAAPTCPWTLQWTATRLGTLPCIMFPYLRLCCGSWSPSYRCWSCFAIEAACTRCVRLDPSAVAQTPSKTCVAASDQTVGVVSATLE